LSLAEGLAHLLKPDASVEQMYEQMTPAVALPFILYIALAPGFAEEILFRGYAQRRLLERWPAWIAILVTSAVFALFHVTPTAMVAVFPLGVWLGVLAWRTGSVWPGIVCHATVNGVWNVRNVGMALGYFPKETPLLLLIVLGIAGSVAFVWALALLFGQRLKESPPGPAL
jgi:membrane protease YdiL (CAAX protease family)